MVNFYMVKNVRTGNKYLWKILPYLLIIYMGDYGI